MDRRQAIKKLGAGGAIAVGASAVLSSNQVAFAASCVVDPQLPSVVLEGNSGGPYWRVSDTTVPPAGVTPNYIWRIRSYANLGPGSSNRLKIAPNSQAPIFGPSPQDFSGTVSTPSSGAANSAVISRSRNNAVGTDGFEADNAYVTELEITWSGACDTTVATFQISQVAGSGTQPPSVTQLS